MPHILPLRGIMYNVSVSHLDNVLCPPYDIISPELQNELYERDAHNFVQLDFAREENRYVIANERYHEWKRVGILIQDEQSALYLLEQQFQVNNQTHIRRGFFALCRLEEIEENSTIRRHEKTLSTPKEDRLNLLHETGVHFSPVFSLFSDTEFFTDERMNVFCDEHSPFTEFTYENIFHRLWKITDVAVIEKIIAAMNSSEAVIADVHHRYETALNYRRQQQELNPQHTGNEGYNYTLMYFANVQNEGLCILPTHRLLHSLPGFDEEIFLRAMKKYFFLRQYFSLTPLLRALENERNAIAFALPSSRTLFFAQLRDEQILFETLQHIPAELRKLDVTILHSLLFEQVLGISKEQQEQKTNIHYEQDAFRAVMEVKNNNIQAAFLLKATRVDQVFNVAMAGSTMPQKSTYFFPKLPSGIVLFDTKQI